MSDQLPLADFAPAAQLPDPEEMDLRDLARLDGVPDALFTLLIANPRKPELLAQMECIKQLMADGYTGQDISAATGLNNSAICRRLRMDALIPELRNIHQGGGLTNACAESCAKLPAGMQLRLAEKAQAQGGKLTARDVADEKRVRSNEVARQLPECLFATPGAVEHRWQATAQTRLQDVLAIVPADQTQTRVAIKMALQSLAEVAVSQA